MTPRNVLVTGGSSGIGRAIAEEAARRGGRITLVARDEERLHAVAASLPGHGHAILVADVATPQGIARVVEALQRDDPRVDILVNAAGVGLRRPFPTDMVEAEQRQIEVNVTAVMCLSHAAARVMIGRRDGAIVNVASTAAYWSAGTYAASKAWVLAATLGLAAQCEPHGVVVQALVPGFTRTQFHARSATDASGVPDWLWLDPRDVARACLDGLGRRQRVCIPTRRYRVLVELVRHLPPGGRAAVLRRLAPLGPLPAD